MCDYEFELEDRPAGKAKQKRLSNRLYPDHVLDDGVEYSCSREQHSGERCIYHRPKSEKTDNELAEKLVSDINNGVTDFVGTVTGKLNFDKQEIDSIESDVHLNGSEMDSLHLSDCSINKTLDISAVAVHDTIQLSGRHKGEFIIHGVTADSVEIRNLNKEPIADAIGDKTDDTELELSAVEFDNCDISELVINTMAASRVEMEYCAIDLLRLERLWTENYPIELTYTEAGILLIEDNGVPINARNATVRGDALYKNTDITDSEFVEVFPSHVGGNIFLRQVSGEAQIRGNVYLLYSSGEPTVVVNGSLTVVVPSQGETVIDKANDRIQPPIQTKKTSTVPGSGLRDGNWVVRCTGDLLVDKRLLP